MLDFVLVFSLAKLVFDDEVCGQALHFVRAMEPLGDLPAIDLVDQVMTDQHLIMAPHTLEHWPAELYLPGGVIERDNRENWTKAGAPDTAQRATAEVGRRLAAYRPIETDPAIDAELRRIITVRPARQEVLPELPPATEPTIVDDPSAGRRPQPPPSQSTDTRQPGGPAVMTSQTATPGDRGLEHALLRSVVSPLAVLREDARGRL